MRIWRQHAAERGIDSDLEQSDPAGTAIARICVIVSLFGAGCTGTRTLSIGLDHPANPQAEQAPPPRLHENLGPDAQTERTHELIERRAAALDSATAPRPVSPEPARHPHPGYEHAHEH
jgi:hypothetical protein